MSPEKRVQLLTAFVDNKTSPMEDISVFLSARNELEVMLTKEAVEMNKQLINEHVEKFGINRHGLARVRDFFIDLRLLNQHSINEAKEQEQEKNKQAEASKPHEQVEPEIDLSTLTADPKSVAELRKYASITVLALLLLVYGQTGFGFLTILCLIVAAGVIGLLFNSSTLNDMIVGYKRGKIEYKIKKNTDTR